MIELTFSKTGQEDIVLTEDDLFAFEYEENAYSGEAFELGGVCAKSIYMMIDNNTQRFSRGTFADCRVRLDIDGNFYGYFNSELPKRRNGVIELNAYDDMVKLDVEFPTDYTFPQTFWAVYAQCVYEAGLASEIAFDNVILNGVWDNGIITAGYAASGHNDGTLHIEVCYKQNSGEFEQASKTALRELVQYLMKKYSIPANKVLRHYDLTGKRCPAYYADETRWALCMSISLRQR